MSPEEVAGFNARLFAAQAEFEADEAADPANASPDTTGLREAVERVRLYVEAVPTLYDEASPMPEGLTLDTATEWVGEGARTMGPHRDLLFADVCALLAAHPDPEPGCRKCGEPAAHHGKHNECIYTPELDSVTFMGRPVKQPEVVEFTVPNAGDVSDHAALTDAERAEVFAAGVHTFGCWNAEHEPNGARQDTITAAVERIIATRVAEAVEQERAAWVAKVTAMADEHAANGAMREAAGKPAWPNNVARDLRALLPADDAEATS